METKLITVKDFDSSFIPFTLSVRVDSAQELADLYLRINASFKKFKDEYVKINGVEYSVDNTASMSLFCALAREIDRNQDFE